MSCISLFLISFSLAMDAFAVSISAGITFRKTIFRHALILAGTFGIFQAFMPFLGWLGGYMVHDFIQIWTGWIAFVLLAGIGGNMIHEAISDDDTEKKQDYITLKSLLLLGIATSIDALAVGITFALQPIHIGIAISMIGVTTFILCFVGVYIGAQFGHIFEKKAEILGGIILIIIGLKILIQNFLY